jgi:hypothetical protein
MKRPCDGGPGAWTLHTMVASARLSGGRPAPSTEHFFSREEALAAQAAWKDRYAGNPDAVASVAPWRPAIERKRAPNKARRR